MWIITFDCDIYFKTYISEIPKVIWPITLFQKKKLPSAFWKLRYFKSKQTKIAFLIKCLRLLVIDPFTSTPTPFAGSLQHSHEAVLSTLEDTVAQTTHSFFFSAGSHMPPCGTPNFLMEPQVKIMQIEAMALEEEGHLIRQVGKEISFLE